MWPSRIGAAAGITLLVLVVAPYSVAGPGAVGVYYGAGVVGPPMLAVFAGIALIALLSGTTGRSDPALTAGIAVTLTGFVGVLGVGWALAAAEPAGGLTTNAAVDYHRWAFAATLMALFGAAVWHAWSTVAR